MLRFSRGLSLKLVGLLLVIGSGSAVHAASGLLIAPTSLTSTVRTQLETDIAAAKLANPAAFANARGSIASVSGASRTRAGDLPMIRLEGAAMILPIIEILAFDAPAQGSASTEAWRVWTLSLVDSLGRMRATRGVPVLIAALDAQSDADLLTTTAAALGRMRTSDAVTKLVAMAKAAGTKLIPILQGMRTCRKQAAADAIAAVLAPKPATAIALPAVRALGSIANADAWKAPGMSGTEGEAVRKAATKTLVSAYVRYPGSVREASRVAMMVVGHATLRAELTNARATADTTTKAEIDKLLALPVSTWMP